MLLAADSVCSRPGFALVDTGLDSRDRADPLEVVRLRPVMELTEGAPWLTIGQIDGPVAIQHEGFAASHVRQVGSVTSMTSPASTSARHGTFMAGLIGGARGPLTTGLAPVCPLLIRPIFGVGSVLTETLADAMTDLLAEGVQLISISAEVVGPVAQSAGLAEALGEASRLRTLVVAAMGNGSQIDGSPLTRHSVVTPVVAATASGWPASYANLSLTAGRRGLRSPGVGLRSLDANGGLTTMSGSSVAACLVTGAVALVWSLHPHLGPELIRRALLGSRGARSLIPPLLNAWGAHEALAQGR
jgi:subtilisin family serine protease